MNCKIGHVSDGTKRRWLSALRLYAIGKGG